MQETFNEWVDICLNQNIDARMRISHTKGNENKKEVLRITE